MAALFNSPKMPTMQQPPPIPTRDAAEVRKAGDDRLRVTAGRAANYLTNPSAGYTAVDKKQMLGSL